MEPSHAECPLCRSGNAREVETYTAILNLHGNSESSVVGCTACGGYYLWPYIADELISELYSRSYFTGMPEGNGKLTAPGSNSDYESGVALERLDKFCQTIRRLMSSAPQARSILDIGAATGEFLALAQQHGLTVIGVELSSYAASKAKLKYGFEFHQVPIVDYKTTERHDLIHMNHVFEHFRAPHDVLVRVESLLSDGGMIYVEVPFQFNVIEVIKYRLTGARKPFDVSSLHHPVFYRPGTLKRIFEQHGFKCRQIRVFRWSRYPARGLRGQAKRLMWFFASLLGQGLMIEAIFERKT